MLNFPIFLLTYLHLAYIVSYTSNELIQEDNMTREIVKTQNLHKVYDQNSERPYEALKGISFTVDEGDFVGIMGASGSGKTTLLNILATLDKPTSGSVQIDGNDITQLTSNEMSDFRSQKLGFIFQDFNLLETLTVFENIALPLSLQNIKGRLTNQKVRESAAKLGIEELLAKYPTQLSGGQKQRVAAARALVSNPSIIFGDEPTGALDSTNARELLDTLKNINRQGVSVLLVTHDPFSASFCKRILFIKDGKIGDEIQAGNRDRTQFYQEILEKLGTFEQ
ncbi:ABC transporter ATP-binding protein [Lentilactobacillus hilgardii]|uniref:ATP-binding cassette domain-containing protein n=2 Tax=Lentilactobacillus hilgardii TaxID=1588 RepID=A0A6P1E3V7_LENHI|nr:ABC transporter, ATP-binding protein [Lentilactobacillus hilgardii ATCC 27305]MBZ2201702.1 ABC transporter ATP-binding protein [Lentilactobacillus hilgardii]RRG10106.1 MAG: ABC transporter ATP-binding protein [Lactobacillus sp.]MBZ2204373.1 ABC transporter ATP-binding protein [Lentilactobacillus hilgardii]MCT3391123.1 ABC transporter ATP-binding protein [Lentilactobacillus hilgardii]